MTALPVCSPTERLFKGKEEKHVDNVSILTFAGALVRLQLHEVRAGAGEGLVKVDETQVGAEGFTIGAGTRIGG